MIEKNLRKKFFSMKYKIASHEVVAVIKTSKLIDPGDINFVENEGKKKESYDR